MIDGVRPYAEYRESGVPWLGRVPAHWAVRRTGALFLQRTQTGFGTLPILEVSLRTGVRVRELTGPGRKQVLGDRDGYKRAARGDVTFNMMRMWQGASGVAPCDGLVSPAYVVARPHNDACAPYYAHLFRTPDYLREADTYSRGIVSDRNRLYWEAFKQIALPQPPRAEQEAIVEYLGAADRRISRYVRAKQRLIALLDEQVQATVYQAVTRGTDSDVSLKPSGVDWLGDVPANWTLAPLKRVARLRSGDAITSEAIDDCGPYPVYGGNGRRGYTQKYTHHGEYALIGRQGALCGNVNYATGRFWASEHAIVAELRGPHHVRWLGELLRVMNLGQYSQAAAQPGLAVETIEKLWIAVPPYDEQARIVAYLDDVLGRSEAARTQARYEINLVREYRTRLIVDVVTGKLDVRAAAALLPGEVDEPSPLALDGTESFGNDVADDAADLEPVEG